MIPLEELEQAIIQRAPFPFSLEDGADHRSLRVDARPNGYPRAIPLVVCDRDGTWVAHDDSATVRTHGWLWNDRPADVGDVTRYHGVRDDWGELSVTVTLEDVCPLLLHLMSAIIEIEALSRRLRGAGQPGAD